VVQRREPLATFECDSLTVWSWQLNRVPVTSTALKFLSGCADLAKMASVTEAGHSKWQHLLVVDSDPVALESTKAALCKGGYSHITATSDPVVASRLLTSDKFDLVLTERWFLGSGNLDLLHLARSRDERLPVLVMTSDANITTAVEALRSKAADVLTKPFTGEHLVERVNSVLRDRSIRRGAEVALAIGAHPDDVEIGAGAALLAHRARGDRVAILIMSSGDKGGVALEREREAAAAAEMLGAELMIGSLRDTEISEHGPTVKLVEESIAWVGATRIYTHSPHDRHQDHRNTHAAVMIASRKIPHVYGFQSPSSTIEYRPTRFESIDDYLTKKLALIACHQSQMESRDYLDEEFSVATARYWGRFGISRYAEAFEVLRQVQGLPVRAQVATPIDVLQELIDHGVRARD
jgi:two-component system, NtrC family, response regulator HydG